MPGERFHGFQNLIQKRVQDVLLVSTLYDYYILASKEVAVAGSTVGYAPASELIFSSYLQLIMLTTAGNDNGLGCVVILQSLHYFDAIIYMNSLHLIKHNLSSKASRLFFYQQG